MRAEELLGQVEKEGRTEDVHYALFYGVPGFTVMPCTGTVKQKEGDRYEIKLRPAGSQQEDTLELAGPEISMMLGISPAKLLSHPEHLSASEIRKGEDYAAVITYDKSGGAARKHLIALLEEFIAYTGIDTKEKLYQAAASGRQRLKEADERYKMQKKAYEGKKPGGKI